LLPFRLVNDDTVSVDRLLGRATDSEIKRRGLTVRGTAFKIRGPFEGFERPRRLPTSKPPGQTLAESGAAYGRCSKSSSRLVTPVPPR
jgi:hypothetical protein